jgi:hypothetical protein
LAATAYLEEGAATSQITVTAITQMWRWNLLSLHMKHKFQNHCLEPSSICMNERYIVLTQSSIIFIQSSIIYLGWNHLFPKRRPKVVYHDEKVIFLWKKLYHGEFDDQFGYLKSMSVVLTCCEENDDTKFFFNFMQGYFIKTSNMLPDADCWYPCTILLTWYCEEKKGATNSRSFLSHLFVMWIVLNFILTTRIKLKVHV